MPVVSSDGENWQGVEGAAPIMCDEDVFIWRDESGKWAGRLIIEDKPGATAEWTKAFQEKQVLLGTYAQRLEQGPETRERVAVIEPEIGLQTVR